MRTGWNWRRTRGNSGGYSGIGSIVEPQGLMRLIAALQRCDAPPSVLEAIARLPLCIILGPFVPAGQAVTERDLLIQVQAVAVLEPEVAFIDELDARTAGGDRARHQRGDTGDHLGR
jgi:hypothetical protein